MWLKEMKQPAPTCRPPIAVVVVVAVVLSKMSTAFVKALPVAPASSATRSRIKKNDQQVNKTENPYIKNLTPFSVSSLVAQRLSAAVLAGVLL
jgi:hypothetical protein